MTWLMRKNDVLLDEPFAGWRAAPRTPGRCFRPWRSTRFIGAPDQQLRFLLPFADLQLVFSTAVKRSAGKSVDGLCSDAVVDYSRKPRFRLCSPRGHVMPLTHVHRTTRKAQYYWWLRRWW